MAQTVRAVVAAALIALAAVGGVAAFLGVPTVTALVAGLVAALLAGALIAGASRRAATFHDPTDPTDEDRRG